MKRLLLLRHAKAEADGKDGSGDHARKLTARGRNDAARIGAYLHEQGYTPDLVLCSTSARTRETWSLVSEELGASAPVEFLKPLYLAPPNTIIAIAQAVDKKAGTLLMIGHNPGTEDAAALFARAPASREESQRLNTLTGKFPTAAVAVLEFEVAQWQDVRPGTGALTAFIRPKDLD